MIKRKWMSLILVALIVPNLAFSGLKCLFVTSVSGFVPNLTIPVEEKLIEWECEMTIISTSECELYTLEDYQNYDFVFIDEVVGSSTLEPIDLLEGHPIPLISTEGYAGRLNILAYRGSNDAANIPAELVEIVADGHPMCAGFALGDQISINDGGGVQEDLITSEPEIDAAVPIAVSTSNKDLLIIYGVEAEGETMSGIPILNRAAVLGYHANGYAGINDNGWAMLKAAIDWVTESTDVEDDVTPLETYRLAQNFPNPFNPETTIEFQLEQPGYTNVSVYNSAGQLVTTLVDGHLMDGNHQVTFRAENNPSGVYFYKIQSGDFSATQKMLLMK